MCVIGADFAEEKITGKEKIGIVTKRERSLKWRAEPTKTVKLLRNCALVPASTVTMGSAVASFFLFLWRSCFSLISVVALWVSCQGALQAGEAKKTVAQRDAQGSKAHIQLASRDKAFDTRQYHSYKRHCPERRKYCAKAKKMPSDSLFLHGGGWRHSYSASVQEKRHPPSKRQLGVYVEALVGMSRMNGGENQTIYVPILGSASTVGPGGIMTIMVPFSFRDTSKIHDRFLWGVGVGMRDGEISGDWIYRIGLAYYQAQSDKKKGVLNVWNKDIMYYKYKILSRRLMLESRLEMQTTSDFTPYIAFGLGYAINRFSDYKNMPIAGTSQRIEYYPEHKQYDFAWQAGLGVEYRFYEHTELALNWQYVDVGKASSAVSKFSNSRFKVGRLRGNEVSLRLAYLF